MTDGRSNWTSEEIDLVVALRNQGHAWRAIARKLGRSDVMCRYQYEQHTGIKVSGDSRLPSQNAAPKVADVKAERGPKTEPLPVGHPVVMRGLWRGMEGLRDSIMKKDG